MSIKPKAKAKTKATRAKSVKQRLLDAKRAGWADWIRSEADERAVSEGCYFDTASAERPRNFFHDLLRHSKGELRGQPFDLLEWQYRDIVGPMFGWLKADGGRRYRRAYIEIPKKNGKSTLCSGLGIYLTVGDNEPGAHVFACAAARDQAKLVFDEAANMVEASPELLSILKVRRATNVIQYTGNRSKLTAIAADAGKAEGKDAHAIIADELHAWKGREFYESLRYSGLARPRHLFVMITTAGDNTQSVCYEEHERALRINRGEEFDSSYLAYVRCAEITDDWKDPKIWRKANPSLGATIKEEVIAAEVKEASGNPRKEWALKRYVFNIWGGASVAWMSIDLWDACRGDYSIEDFAGCPAWAGIDLSRTQDLSALVWIVRGPDGWVIIPRLFCPEGLLESHEKTDKVPYRAWVEAGHLIPTQGDSIDTDRIRQQVHADAEILDVRELGYDPTNADNLCNVQLRLQDGFSTIAIPQNMAQMGPPTSELERCIKARQIQHPNNPVLNWMLGNTAVYEDMNKNIRPVKKKARGRIDGIVGTIIGLGRAIANGGGPMGSYYDDNDVELI